MQDFMEATLLFTAYFCFACCFFYTPNNCTEQLHSEPEKPNKEEKELPLEPTQPQNKPEPMPVPAHRKDPPALEDPWALKPLAKAQEQKVDETPQPIAEPVADTLESRVDEPVSNSPTIEELLTGVDLDNLQLRPARKIAGKLGIQQKVNGKDQPLSWLRVQIKKRFSEKPIETAPVIAEALKAS
jgi:hypothetical protein